MPIEGSRLKQEWSDIQAALEERGVRRYPGPLFSTDNVALWSEDRPYGEFLDFAEACDRKIVYTSANEFGSEDALELLLLVGSLDLPVFDLETPKQWLDMTGLDATDEGQEYLRAAGIHYGELFRFSVHWAFEGVVHTYRHRADWHERLELQAGRLVEIAESDY